MIRILDVTLSLLALLFMIPLLLPVALLLRLTGEGEVLFRQSRVGLNGEQFLLLKFATMLKNSPNMGTGVRTLKNDPRVLPVGTFLRRTKINELPQLVNVLTGEMSLIGPRPQAHKVFALFPEATQEVLKSVRPGLSGVGSILFRDEEELVDRAADKIAFYENAVAPYKGEIECWYARNSGLALYFKLIFLTIWVVVVPQSTLHWRLLAGLPPPPLCLRKSMRYDDKSHST